MPSPPRAPLPDNLRGLLLLLVGMGHGLEPLLAASPRARAAYSALYLFHVPAFAALSGHLSRPRWPPASHWKALLVPLAVGQALYVAVDGVLNGQPLSSRWLVQPYWVMWFLLSLATWRALLPLWMRLRWPLAWAVGAALAAGLLPQVGYPLSLSRTFAFLPFFIAGHVVPATWLAWLRGRGGRALGVLAFALLGAWTWALATGALPFPDTRLLYGTSSYPGMGMAPLQGALSRAALVACGLLLTAAAWSLSPGRTGWLTRFGAASLWPYVLHGLLLRAVPLQSGLLGLVPLFQLPAAALAGLAAVIVPAARTLGGSSPPSDRAR